MAFHPNLLKSVTETIVKKASSRLNKWSLLLLSGCDGVCDSKDSDFYCQWQWWSLFSYCGSLFLAKPQAPIKNGSDVVYDGACFYLRTVVLKSQVLTMTESVSISMFWWSVFSLVRLQVSTINDNDGFYAKAATRGVL